PAIYGRVVFSAHMVNHMILTMLIPIFLVRGAPITLAMRSMESRKDGTRGPREYMLTLLQSKYSKVITNPIFAAVNFAGSLVIIYFTPVFEFALRYHIGHEMMNIHFLLTGFIFVSVMIGIDPLPNRPSYPLRLVILLATMVFHAFIAVSLTGSDSLLMSEWFSAIGRDWGASAIEDQQIGGLIMWGTGEFPTVGMAMIVLFRWRQDDMQHAKRRDDRVDRLGDSDLDDLNEYYARMAVANEETNHDPNR
ncbi:MAG: cytochrome c oxidase assembly protein, partial [Yaniella sp.]|nr:cytochrome c oxidase assembly protein [Yaniella sp.]